VVLRPYEVRTYTAAPQNYDPDAPAASPENTLKEPWICPYCGYSTGGTWDLTGAAANPPFDSNGNLVPDEAEGDCPNPWGFGNHPANTALVPATMLERFMALRWLGPVGAPVLTLLRGLPFKPGDVDPAVTGATNALSRVRAAFAFDPGGPGRPQFTFSNDGDSTNDTQVRFLLIPPGVARPTARYHSLQWEPGGSQSEGGSAGSDEWGGEIAEADIESDFRIGVNPWRAVDGDRYFVRIEMENSSDTDLDVVIWSEVNGPEYTGAWTLANDTQIITASGAVRVSLGANLVSWYSDGDPADDPDPEQWWVFSFEICNNSRTIPSVGATPPDWLNDPTTVVPADPLSYFVVRDLGTTPGRAGVLDTDGVGDPATGTPLSDASAVDFRLRPGETGTGMVALLWRNDAANMWSYDEDEDPSDPAPAAGQTVPDTGESHDNAVQPIAARFFCSRVDAGDVPVLDMPEGGPGGATRVANTDLTINNRQVGEIARCPIHAPNVAGRSSGATDPYIDPDWAGNSPGNGNIVGRGPGGDPPLGTDHNGDSGRPVVTIGCGAVHVIDPANDCWCGRRHNPAAGSEDTMYCNYCGTRLLTTQDTERAAAQVDVAPPPATASHQAVADADGLNPDRNRLRAVFALAPEAVRTTRDGAPAPGATYNGTAPATLRAITQPLFVNIPPFQLASYAPAGPNQPFANGAPQPYQGTYLAYRAADEDRQWFEDQTDGTHDLYTTATTAFAKAPLFDHNHRWDTSYRCPDCGNKEIGLALRPGAGAQPYVYTDNLNGADWAVDLECSYGRNVNVASPNSQLSECPGHQICEKCGATWEAQGEGQTAVERQNMTLTVCPFDGTALVNATTEQNRFMADYLTAEEFDPFIVQAHVMRKTRLTAQSTTVDLGRVAPGLPGGGFPSETSAIAVCQAENQSNYTLRGRDVNNNPLPLLTQSVMASNPTATRIVTTGATEAMSLMRANVTAGNYGSHRLTRTMPVTGERLFASVADEPPGNANWAGFLLPREGGAAGGGLVAGLVQAGHLDDPANPNDSVVPLPNGLPAGNYAGNVLAFVDTNGDGQLSYLDRSTGPGFDPGEDYPLEPVVPVNLRLRVVETPLPANAPAHSDGSPAALPVDTDGDGRHDTINVVWETGRSAAPATPNDAVNLAGTTTQAAGGPGIARDLPWAGGIPWALTADAQPGTVNGSPETYVDPTDPPGPATSLRWLLWHKQTPTPTDVGAMSTLWSAQAPADMSAGFGAPSYIFDSSLDKSFIRGFIDPQAGAPANHWSFWTSGRRGREEIHYCAGYNPADPNTVDDRVLPVSNGVSAAARQDWVDLNGTWTRKPPKSPFTAARDASPVLEIDPSNGQWLVHVFFAGHVPQEGNSDICHARFVMADLGDADANYGKLPQARIAGPFGGEELRSDGPRQTFAARHLDWVTTRRPVRATAGADFMRARAAGLDPALYIHLALPGSLGAPHEVYRVDWQQEVAATDALPHRYDRSEGAYRLTNLTFTRLAGGLFGPTITPIEPRTGRPLEMRVDPAAGMVQFSAPLFNPTNPADPATFFNSTAYAGIRDVQLWAEYTPYVYRLCRDDANDDSPSAFFDYAGPNLAVPAGMTAQARASLGHFMVFWRRSHASSAAPHFGRTSFMYRSFTTAVTVPPAPIARVVGVTDVTPGLPPLAMPVVGQDLQAGLIGLPAASGGQGTGGRRVRIEYDIDNSPPTIIHYATVQGWGEEKRANVDTVFSEGPLVVKREWYTLDVETGTPPNVLQSTQHLARYWLFWTSPRSWYDPTVPDEFQRSRDVYYATVVPDYDWAEPEVDLASQ
jgi:hypothetical protein